MPHSGFTCRQNLATSDPAKARAFYGALLELDVVMDIRADCCLKIGRLLFNRLIAVKILPERLACALVRHHVEEIGNLQNFLPQLYREETASANRSGRQSIRCLPNLMFSRKPLY